MRGRIFPILLLTAVPAVIMAADTTFRHPQGFSLLVPEGWTPDSQDSGVSVARSPAYVSVFAFDGSGNPRALIQSIVPSLSKSWRNFAELRESDCTIAGEAAACGWYAGIDRKGVDSTLKMGAFVRDGKGYLVMVCLPKQNPEAFERDANRIEQSFARAGFTPTNATLSATQKTQLAAIDDAYQKGVLSTEEYETKRRALLGGQTVATAAPHETIPTTAPVPASPPSRADAATGNLFTAPDRSFAARIPAGWEQLRGGPGLNGIYIFGPAGGGDERIFVGGGPLLVNNIQQLAGAAAGSVTIMFPALRLAQPARYGQLNGLPVAELVFSGRLPTGEPVDSWYSVTMAGRKYVFVLTLSGAARAAGVREDARSIFTHLQF